jgi:hypothetical protein
MDLFLFTVSPDVVSAADEAGVDGFVVDWEHAGKLERQRAADTQVNAHTETDLRVVRASTRRRVLCRINAVGPNWEDEIERALDGGADELLLPMVRTMDDASRVLDQLRGRRPLGLLIETREAVRLAPALCRLPLSRVYVGLNDLAIDRGSDSIFEGITDGTVAAVRSQCTPPFGFAGLTHPQRGTPIPCWLLLNEMVRLQCAFTFLRRSFCRDVPQRDFASALADIHTAVATAARRPPSQVATDQADLLECISHALTA